ncbi:hypothetical protein EBH_0033520 [Eimeria brunetti]|uniref:Uncharacterized protein n=1 Tax=Eimeria brunetti TaxID=51314 RepID=U6LME1_9EIME|nr:hypothetical protein EBH_0033520 [Eimeria brunetti]
MTMLFQRLCDRAQSHIQKAKWQQELYADSKRRAVECLIGAMYGLAANIYRLSTTSLSLSLAAGAPLKWWNASALPPTV